MKRLPLVIGFAVSLALPASSALAQDVSTAKALFQKGVDDMQAGKYDTGCPALQESYRLDPRAGTLFALADCYAKAGKTASAVARYEDYLSLFSRMTPAEQAKQNGRDQNARDEHDKLKVHVPTLTLKLDSGAPAGTTVTRDGETLGQATLGLALPIDPGTHTIVTQAPGAKPTTTSVEIKADDKKDLTLKVDTAPGSGTNPPPVGGGNVTPGGGGSGQGGGGSGGAQSDTRGDAQRIAGIALIGVGGAGLLVGAITGGLAVGAKSTISDNCDLTTKVCKNQAGLDAVHSGQTEGTVASAMLPIGGVLAVAGVITYFVAPKHAAQAKVGFTFGAGPGGGAVGVNGRF